MGRGEGNKHACHLRLLEAEVGIKKIIKKSQLFWSGGKNLGLVLIVDYIEKILNTCW